MFTLNTEFILMEVLKKSRNVHFRVKEGRKIPE